MVIQLEKSFLFSTFGVDSFAQLQTHIDTMAPSMVEYYLSDLASSQDDSQSAYINKTNVEQHLSVDEYSIYLDYNENIFLEFTQNESEYVTQSLW